MSLSKTLAAVADPTRRAILNRLATGEKSVMELARPFSMSQPAISRHLRVLERAGLIVRRVDGARRPCRLTPDGLNRIDQWLATMRRAMEANHSRLDGVRDTRPPFPESTR